MAYTAQQLITDALYLSNLVSRQLQTVSNAYLYDGLDRLNAALAIATNNNALIPYWQLYEFDMVIGQEVYFIPNLVQVETVTFNIQDVRYPLQDATREQYFAYARVDDIETLPYQWHLERVVGGCNLYIYYLPQENYPSKLVGKFQLTSVTLMTDMTINYDTFYIEYLKYKTASLLCQYYQVQFSPEKQKQLDSYEQTIKNVSPLDLTVRKVSVFQTPGMPDYVQANLGHGWEPL